MDPESVEWLLLLLLRDSGRHLKPPPPPPRRRQTNVWLMSARSIGATLGQQSIKQRKQLPIASVRANYIAQGANQGEKLGGPESPAVDSYSHRAWAEVLLCAVVEEGRV